MLTLGIDSSAAAASAAIVEDGKLLGEYYVNTKQTHGARTPENSGLYLPRS